MSSFWWNFHHWLHWKLSFWQLSVQPVMKISSKWRHFRFSASQYIATGTHNKSRTMCIIPEWIKVKLFAELHAWWWLGIVAIQVPVRVYNWDWNMFINWVISLVNLLSLIESYPVLHNRSNVYVLPSPDRNWCDRSAVPLENHNEIKVHYPMCWEFTAQRSVTRSFYIFFDLRLNKPLSKQ